MFFQVFDDFMSGVTPQQDLFGRLNFATQGFFRGIERFVSKIFLFLVNMTGPCATDNKSFGPGTREYGQKFQWMAGRF